MKNALRRKLLDAAPALAAQIAYEELSIAALCRAAGVATNDFKAAFGDLQQYVEALQQQFLDDIRARIIKVTSGTQPGLLRIRLASESYLAHCAEMVAVRRWLLAARAQPAILRGLQQQNQNFALLLGTELHALGRRHAGAVARLYIAMLNEVAAAEDRLGHPHAACRAALTHFLERAGATEPAA